MKSFQDIEVRISIIFLQVDILLAITVIFGQVF